MASNLEIFEPIWKGLSPEYQSRIPTPSQANMAQIGVIISADDYEPIRNEIFDKLINLIGKQKVWQMSITNPLSVFKTGQMSYGDTFQEIMSDVIEGQTFEIAEQDQFKKWKNNVYAAYHRVNREMFYPVTTELTKINRAFMREGGLQALVNSLVNQMYSSNNLDEFLYTKRLIHDYYHNVDVPLAPAQKLQVPNPGTPNALDRNAALAFAMTVKGLVKEMAFPKTIYNPNGLMMQTQQNQFCIMLRTEISTVVDVNTLSQVFHNKKVDIEIPIVEVDTFGDGMENVVGMVMDKRMLYIMDTLRTLRMADNARNLYRNYYYHVHQLYAASPFVQCVFLENDPALITP